MKKNENRSFNLTPKQKEFWKNANKRWNIKEGATRSGKTWLDYYIIPYRIRAIKGKSGIVLLLGNTQSTLERNVLEPMRNIYGSTLVGNVNSQNKVRLFGRVCYALGADKVSQVKKIQGASVAYCYGDEVVTWNKEVFNMLKSRLDKPYSKFDGTCNPEGKNHWFLKFLESDADIFRQQYTINDNNFLPPEFVEALKKEYKGTVYYNRYILGQWCNAEGLVFPYIADNPERYTLSDEEFKQKASQFRMVNVGVDIGGTRSHTPVTATGVVGDYKELVTFKYDKLVHAKRTINTDKICQLVINFCKELLAQGYYVRTVYVDNAEQVILNTILSEVRKANLPVKVDDCKKEEGATRIQCYHMLHNTDKLKYYDVPEILNSLGEQLYKEDSAKDEIVDDFTTDVDTYDSHFYSFSAFYNRVMKYS